MASRYTLEQINKMDTERLAQVIGQAWEEKDSDTFLSLFSEDAVISHPLVEEGKEMPVGPVLKVIGAGDFETTRFHGIDLISGAGEGEKDKVRMNFLETGTRAGYTPRTLGIMQVDATIEDHHIQHLNVIGYREEERAKYFADPGVNPMSSGRFHINNRNFSIMNAPQLCMTLCIAWGSNDMDYFTSMFHRYATLDHPLFKEEISPETAANILSSKTSVNSSFINFKLKSGDGSGKNDVVHFACREMGIQLGFLPDICGIMHLEANIMEQKFANLIVKGYSLEQIDFASMI